MGCVRENQLAQIMQMRWSPAGFTGVAITFAQKEGVEPLFGAGQVVTGVGSSATDIANRFVQCRWDTHSGEVSIAEKLGDVFGVAFVGLDLFVGFGRGDDDAFGAEFLGQRSQGALRRQVAAAAFAGVGGRCSRSSLVIGDGDCFLVNVESDVVGSFHGVLG